MLYILGRLTTSLLLFALLEAGLFHTSLYPSRVAPDSSTGVEQNLIRNEKLRAVHDRNQVLAVGDSRMGLLPRMANELNPGYWFASIAIGGSTPRCWYYMLRDTDPAARRYAAILLPLNDYDVRDTAIDPTERIADLSFVIRHLRVTDLVEFAGSFRTPESRWIAFRSGLLKGFVYKRDFQDFLLHPAARLEAVRFIREGSANWNYTFIPESASLEGLSIDWAKKQIHYPPNLTAAQRRLIADVLLAPEIPQTGIASAYYRQWLGRIVDRYRGSGTKLILLRLPRAPLVRPEQPPPNPASPVRALAAQPGVVLLDEHRFDELERPELFGDGYHLNAEGIRRFSKIVTEEVRRVLGPPAHNAL